MWNYICVSIILSPRSRDCLSTVVPRNFSSKISNNLTQSLAAIAAAAALWPEQWRQTGGDLAVVRSINIYCKTYVAECAPSCHAVCWLINATARLKRGQRARGL